jgi:hypothetical protein
MDNELKRSVAEHITNLVKNVQAPDKLDQFSGMFSSRDGVAFTLSGFYFKEYEETLRALLEDAKWGEVISSSFLDDHLKAIITAMLKEGLQESQDATRHLEQLIADIKSISEIPTIYLSILGMGLDADEFSLANVTLKTYADTVADELVEMTERILRSTKANPGVTNAQMLNNQDQLVKIYKDQLNRFRSGILVERRFQEPIELNLARERTEEETRRLIDLFRYVIAFMHPKLDDITIGLQGDVRQDTRSIFTFSNLGAAYLNQQATGLRRSFVLPTKDTGALEHIGLLAMSDVLKKPRASLTDYEQMLIRGLHLFSDSQMQFEKQSQFIGLWNCIENFISPEHSFTAEVSKRGAVLLTPEHPESLEETREWLHQEYGIRSNLSHGKPRVITDEDLVTLRWAAVLIIRWMIENRNKFKTRSELLDWLNYEKLKAWP